MTAQETRRFTVFATPQPDGRTPWFHVMDRNVAVQTFTKRDAAQAEADRREAA